MSQTHSDSNPLADLNISLEPQPPTEAEAEAIRKQFSRTPRPYHHDGIEVRQDHRHRSSERGLSGGNVAASPGRLTDHISSNEQESGNNNSEWTESTGSEDIAGKLPFRGRKRTLETSNPGDGSESGTEADDERPSTGFGRALLAPTPRLTKGLKSGESDKDALLTPSQLDDEGRRRSSGVDEAYFQRRTSDKKDAEVSTSTSTAAEVRAEQERVQRRRYAEFLRRSCEVALTGVIIGCVLCGRGVGRAAWTWRWELGTYVASIVVLVLAYPVKLSIVVDDIDDIVRHHTPAADTAAAAAGVRPRKHFLQRFRVPASFDPATVLYPPLLPVLVALSMAPAAGGGVGTVVLMNVILGLASLPQRLFPRSSRLGGFNALHWFISIIPLIVSENTTYISKATPPTPYMLKSGPPLGLASETLACLYPLHHALLNPLHYLTTTSLLTSELHLLSVALINLSLLSESPQAVILKACLWIGGISLLIACNSVLTWNVTLARVPRWRLRRTSEKSREQLSLVDAVSELINLRQAVSAFKGAEAIDSDADEDAPATSIKRRAFALPRLTTTGLTLQSLAQKVEPKSAVEPRQPFDGADGEPDPASIRRRRNTVPERDAPPIQSKQPSTRRRRKPANIPWYLHLTPEQATNRKWLYAAITYSVIFVLILGPVRIYVANDALNNQEPIAWAFSYLFSQFYEWPDRLVTLGWLEPTISYIPPWDLNPIRIVFGTANWRLVTIAYWVLVLAAGLLTVFSLTAYVEVDTRRKVFHGVMVAMFMPALYFDPCFCALALTLVLAAFLLLEVLRASHVPPLGNVIGRFVAPYVDGRDLRGPVVVSHIFLLIGCAVPLWFSLACFQRTGVGSWKGWDVGGNLRETAMLAGVICVGMGDAAASLIGRRIGRHKWPWVGGKSFEGSAAFAIAVTAGLMTGKWWLVNCGWKDAGQTARFDAGVRVFVVEWGLALIKATFCACTASFMEAVLTGANDNVVVPIVLWLLVKGVRL